MSRPPLTVVIPTRDRPGQLASCLATVMTAVGPDDEVLVIDSASRDPAAVAEVATDAGARLLRTERPGASLARNLGWRAAANERIAFVDDDVRVDPGWADAMVAALAVPGTHWVTGLVGMRPEETSTALPAATLVESEPKILDGSTGEHPGHSANLGIHRAAADRVGGFDERLGPGRPFEAAEDVDLFDRLLTAGLHGRYDPSVRATHEQWRTRRERMRLDWGYGKGSGARLAKLVRLDRRRARLVYRVTVVDWGVGSLLRDLHARHEYLSLVDVVRLAGMATGFVRALVIPLRDGHLRPFRDQDDATAPPRWRRVLRARSSSNAS